MSTVLVSIEEYLNTSYSPDREYVDGVIVERHLGERPHSLLRKNILISLQTRYPHLFVWPEQRVCTVPGRRSRVPDICITLQDPGIDVFEAPPFITIEILSRRDEMSDVLEKLEEYTRFGVANAWLIDPRRRKAFVFQGRGLQEVEEALETVPEQIRLPLEDVFRGL